ncbi:hypothetical protein V8E52_009045 [Russula decolorans]
MQTRSSKSASSEEDKAYWSIKDEATLIKFFLGRRASFTSNEMFKKTVFADAAKEVNSMREKGSEKTGASCKAKWGKLKRVYVAVTALKGKSGIKWSDENGMGITEDTQQQWDEMVKRNDLFKPFAHKGWVHYADMNVLMSSLSQASGSYVHRGTQPSVAATSASVPSLSSTPLDIPSRSSTSSKRKTSPFDVSTRSSASSKRRKPSATAEMSEFKEVFVKLSHRIDDVLL